jgi:hypothetical protein
MRILGPLVVSVCLLGQQAPLPTAVHSIADFHTSRWTAETDPLASLTGVCRITPTGESVTLRCAPPPSREAKTSRQYNYTFVLFQDLEQTLYLTACVRLTAQDPCGGLTTGQTFSAEVQDRTLRIVYAGRQYPLRILERRPRARRIDSPARGTPSGARPSTGTPSRVPYSQVQATLGTPSSIRPSEAPASDGAPSQVVPSDVRPSAASPTSARLHLRCAVGSAQVFVDNQLVGTGTVEVPLLPGRHTVVVRARGYRPWTQTVQLQPGGIARLTAELRR